MLSSVLLPDLKVPAITRACGTSEGSTAMKRCSAACCSGVIYTGAVSVWERGKAVSVDSSPLRSTGVKAS
jgi:hypothetical protein